jgi:phosphoserine phosphatase
MNDIPVKFKSLAVFDMDGTLCIHNTHILVLKKYYKIPFDSTLFKMASYLFPWLFQWLLDYLILYVPENFISKIKFDFNEEILAILNNKIENNFHCIIISNAPYKIVKIVANELNLAFESTKIGEKHNALAKIKYENLFVCTDNISDLSILKLADSSVVLCKPKNRAKFNSINNVTFFDI